MSFVYGRYCDLNYSEFPDLKGRAEESVSYFDSKYPLILEEVGVPYSGARVQLIMKNEAHLIAAKYGECYIKFNPDNVSPQNKGVLLHEGTHVAQNFAEAPWWLIEGMADFVRLKLGWDDPMEPYNFQIDMVDMSASLENQTHYWAWCEFLKCFMKNTMALIC